MIYFDQKTYLDGKIGRLIFFLALLIKIYKKTPPEIQDTLAKLQKCSVHRYFQISLFHTCYKSLPHNNETLIFGGFSLIFIPHSNYEREIYSCIVHFSCFRLRDFELLHRLTFNNTDWVMKFQPNLSTIL